MSAEEPPGTGLPYPPTVEGIAAALASDPVLVDPLFGNGATQVVRAELRELVDAVDAGGTAVYVVMVPPPDDVLAAERPTEDLAVRLSSTLGPGYYAIDLDPVGGDQQVVAVGLDPEVEVSTYRVHDAYRDDLYPTGEYDSAVAPSDLGRTAQELAIIAGDGELDRDSYLSYVQDAPWARPAPWEPDLDPPLTSTYVAEAGLALVVVAGSAWILLRTAATWRGTAPQRAAGGRGGGTAGPRGGPPKGGGVSADGPPGIPASTSVADLRRTVDRELDELAEARAASDLAALPAARRDRVELGEEAARLVLAAAGTRADDLDDVVGALALVRLARFALDDPRRDTVHRSCFFDPRHGRGTRRRRIPLGDTEVAVPACTWCAKVEGARLTPMKVRRRPYYELDTVWASTGYGAFVDDLEHQVLDDLRRRR